MQKLLALDLSVTSTGWCVGELEKFNVIEYGKIVTEKADFENEDNRILFICDQIEQIINKNGINLVTIEEQYAGNNVKTLKILRKLLGAVMRTIKFVDLDIVYFYPSETRKNLNIQQDKKKKLNKEEVGLYIQKNYIDVGEYSDKKNKAKTSDIYDAIALYIAYLNTGRIKNETKN